MVNADGTRKELKNTGYEIFIGILSILSIVNVVMMYVAEDPNLDTVIEAMNWLLSIIFLADFAYRLFTAASKSGYFFRQFGWADLLASLPFPQAKILRVFRLVRVFRLLREFGLKNIGRSLITDRAGSALLTLLLMGILVLEFGSLGILHIEQYALDANITSASDALWYVVVTISTVGYGDRFLSPTTVASWRVDHRCRRRHLRHVHRIPGEPFPRTIEAVDERRAVLARRRRVGQGQSAQGPDGQAAGVHRRDRTAPPARWLIGFRVGAQAIHRLSSMIDEC